MAAHQWSLIEADATHVLWHCSVCARDVGFATEGNGEPWSGADAPPADIDRYTDPCVETAPAAPRLITNYAFRRRLLPQEKAAAEFAMAKLYDPTASQMQRDLAAAISANLRDLAEAKYVNLDDPLLAQALQGYEAVGLIAPGRADEIVNAPITDDERASE
jgi:hypothetical protein